MNDHNRARRAPSRDATPRARGPAAGRRASARARNHGGAIRNVGGAKSRPRSERPRPLTRETEEATRELIRRHGREVLATARRYAANLDDAEDAYQRGLEILLTKAPTTDEVELVRWLKTVVKHEAFNLRRQRERHAPLTDDGELGERPTAAGITHDQAERHERLHQGAEALAQLKPQEARALRLKAEGYSYKEICRITDWTYTKVNRCLTEGRRALRQRTAAIEAGEECERLAPLLSEAADRIVGIGELRGVERHVRGCLHCRARLKSLRAVQCRSQNRRSPKALREAA
jgi:RNA polymerase sigma factor (sigma-70 family)